MTNSDNRGRGKTRPLILVAEDAPLNMEVVCSILKKENYRIAAAGNGIQALEVARVTRPDLILLDVSMPGMDGFEVCEGLKKFPLTADIPVIFLTAKTEPGDIARGFEIGAVDYVTKPFNGAELTHRIKTHLELKFSRERLKDLLNARDRFFSLIAHDLRDPLQFLLLSSEALSNDYDFLDEGRKKDYTRRIFHSSTQISALLENLLDWSRSQQGMIEYHPEKVDIGVLAAESIELLKEQALKKNITLSSEVEPGALALADKNMIRSVIRNLVSNGVKFTNPGGEVKVSASQVGRDVEIAVTDTGIGMKENELAELFMIDRFRIGSGTANEKGTGLGLILSKEFIEKNNGTIVVTSEPGKGSVFRITLPGVPFFPLPRPRH